MGRGEREARSRSPERAHKRRRHTPRSPQPKPAPRPLPLNARELTRHDLRTYKPMFGLYLDIQKQIDIEDLDEAEIKGRWKSFVNKWNRGELAEGWYDPTTLTKAIDAEIHAPPRPSPPPRATHSQTTDHPSTAPARSDGEEEAEEEEDDDDFGPSLPSHKTLTHPSSRSTNTHSSRYPAGPSIPTTSDLRDAHEQATSDAALARSDAHSTLRTERRADRALQARHLEELAPRAEPGSRERQLEKKRDAAAANSAFATAAHEAGDAELRDADVMGDADSLGELKRAKKEQERKKNDRELRREEMLRARRAEREARVQVVQAKEAKTMEMLQELARARFGGGAGSAE